MRIERSRTTRRATHLLTVLVLAGTATCVSSLARAADAHGTEHIVYNFTGAADGGVPYGQIAFSKGNLVGTTYVGGAGNQGTVFKLTKDGQLTTLHNWTGGDTDGEYVNAGVVADGKGNLYGTTGKGGTSNRGIIYKLDTTGNLTVLHSFAGCADGGDPYYGSLILAKHKLYGVTSDGRMQNCPSNWGTVFRVGTDGLKYKVLHAFDLQDPDKGYNPVGSVALSNGVVYGTTQVGGAGSWGIVFQVDASGGNESALYSFNQPDGATPAGGVILGLDGRFYGTTEQGGASGVGNVFVVDAAGTETVLHTFTGTGTDGAYPVAGLVEDAAGNFYGTTQGGGSADGNGTVFEVSSSGVFTTLHSFQSGSVDGQTPFAAPRIDSHGDLYGTTSVGGSGGYGTVYKVRLRQ